MKTVRFAWLITVTLLLIVVGSCGAGHGKAVRSAPIGSTAASSQENQTSVRDTVFTPEDCQVMAMPLQQRITYLGDKYKELVFQMYGIRIDASTSNS